ncbi:hypothetical protein ACA910_010210 [Epithemia clementina (nom. ined.)]
MNGFPYLETKANTSPAVELAVKHDKAEVPTHLWDERVAYLLGLDLLQEVHHWAFRTVRTAMLRRWKRNVCRSWRDWWDAHGDYLKGSQPKSWALIHQQELRPVTTLEMPASGVGITD